MKRRFEVRRKKVRKDFFDKIDNNVMLDFKIEDNDGDEILIYPLVRYLILNELLRKSLKLLPAHSSKRRISNTKIMKYLYYTFKKIRIMQSKKIY